MRRIAGLIAALILLACAPGKPTPSPPIFKPIPKPKMPVSQKEWHELHRGKA